MRLFTLLMILALVGHAWVGMWTVLTDYVKSNGLRFVLQSAMILAVPGLFILGRDDFL